MVVATGEVLAQEFERMIYPVGSPVRYSAYSIGEFVDGEMEERFIMKDGTLVGYDNSFGGIPHVIVEPADKQVLNGRPKNIPIGCLRSEVELIEVDPSVEKMASPPTHVDLFEGRERHAAARLVAYLSGEAPLV